MNQDKNKLEEFNELRQSITNRIEEIEDFFDDNFDNEFIFYFQRGKIKLKKLLMYEPSLIDEIDNGKNVKALIFGQKSHISQSTPDIFVDPETEMTKFSNNYFMNKNKSYQIFSDNNILQTKNNIYNNKTNTSNNTYKKQIKNNFNKNIIKTSNNNTNSKSNYNKNYIMNFSKSNLSYNNYLNKNKKILNKNNNSNYYNYNKKKNNDFKNKYYNDYYNKETRNKFFNTNSDEDSEDKKENKVKYLDWTENNTIQNTNSNQMNSINTNQIVINNENNNKSINSFKKNINNKKNYKRDMIINNEIEYDKYNGLILNKNKNKVSNNINLNKSKNYNSKNNNNGGIEKKDDPNVFKINFFDSNDKEKSLSEISSNRKGENEDSLISNNFLNKEQYKEILFQIKLTKEEYHLLLREKAKIIDPLK